MRPELLINLWSAFPQLVTINLQRTIVFDAPLNTIGQYCIHLRDINLSGTTISDRGARSQIIISHGGGVIRT
jgi:hypothetical protein